MKKKQDKVIIPPEIMRRKNVKQFINAASNWESGYSMGETASIVVKKEDQTTQKYIVKDSRKTYSVGKYNSNIKYGSLSLTIIEREGKRSLYRIDEIVKGGHQTYSDYIQDYRKRKAKHLQAQRIRNDFEKKFLVNDATKSLAYQSLSLWAPSSDDLIDNAPDYQVEHPTMEDYFNNTKVSFHTVESGEPDQVETRWEDMKSSLGLLHHTSPYSSSEYLEDINTGTIYRYSGHWGKCASCVWTLDEKCGNYYAIGKANIFEFERVVCRGTVKKIVVKNINACVEKLKANMIVLSDFLTGSKYAFYDGTKGIFDRLLTITNGIVEKIGCGEYEQAASCCAEYQKYVQKNFSFSII